jgi:hypothetical protein
MLVHKSELKTATFEELDSSDAPSFRQLYEIYQASFPLPDEREPPEAFDAILALNRDRRIQMALGPYREIVAAIRWWEGGPIIGGHVFGITTSSAHRSFGVPASVQGIYTFLHPDCRGVVPIAVAADYSRTVASRVFGPPGSACMRPPTVFFEVNNPLRMTDEEIELDRLHSGVDPARRYMFWLRSGFTPLAFPYVQPRLRDDAVPVRYLDLFCSNDAPEGVPAIMLLNHLYAFVSVSVLKDRDAREDPEFVAMAQWLEGRTHVGLADRRGPAIAAIARRARLARSEARDDDQG